MSVNGESEDDGPCLYGENEEEGALQPETKRAVSPVPSCLSMKSDHSKFEPPAFSGGTKRPRLENWETASPVPSCVSMKSDHSKFEPPAFSGTTNPGCATKLQRTTFSEPSCVSLKSSHSKFEPPAFSDKAKRPRLENQQAASLVSSRVSMKSDHSKFEPPAFSNGTKCPGFGTKQQRTAPSELSCMSLKSNHSKFEPPAFSNGENHPRQAESSTQITKAKTLYIMCHIPIFCWISSIVIQEILDQDECGEIPTTLTEMYIRFMLIQTKTKKLKYHVKEDEEQENEMILKLAELAFKQLIKGNILFYVEDLRECGIDVTQASVYSGVCTEIFKEESVLYQKKVYCFVHLSFQEFFAALFGFHACVARDAEVVKMFPSRSSKHNGTFVSQFMMPAMDAALASKTGHLDLFLRFLYGISRESNWKLLYHIVPPKCMISENFQEAIKCVRQKHPKKVSPERWINFLYCFGEMKDHSFQKQIKKLLNAKRRLTGWECTTIAHTLQTSEEVLDEFDPKKYNTSDEGRRRLIPVVRNCRKALLANCQLTKQHCEIILSALQSAKSVMTELDLSYNNIKDSGVKQICDCLKNPQCKLEILRLVMCNLTKKSCEYLATSLQSAKSTLKELDLSQNDLEDSGVRLLSGALKSPHCQLEMLSLSGCLMTEEGCASLASALSSNPSHMRELDLSYNYPGESGKQLFCSKVDNPNYTLVKLNLNYDGVYTLKPGVRKYACELTVDLNTVNGELVLSEENRKVTYEWEHEMRKSYPDHPDRFECPQLLCRECLSERHYWEVELSGRRAGIAVAYKGTTRKFDGCSEFGSNKDSWGLFGYNYKQKYSVHHKGKKKFIPAPRSHSNRVGGWFMTMNYMVHALMYSYYTIKASGLRLPKPCAMVITVMQILQMAMGLTVLALVYYWHHDVHCASNMNNIVVNGESEDDGPCLYGENEEEGALQPETKRAVSPVPSCLSMKSDHSKFEPPAFSGGTKRPRLENWETASPVPSCVSMKSDHSKFEPPAFSGTTNPGCATKLQRTTFSEPSCVSLKSSHSKFEPPAFSDKAKRPRLENQQAASLVSSSVSMKSDHSKFEPPAFSDGTKCPGFGTKQQRTAPSELSCMSLKSNHSKFEPPAFSNGENHPRMKNQQTPSLLSSCVSMKSDHSKFEPPAFSDGRKHLRCGLCDQILKVTASSSCGHSVCSQCISKYQDQSVDSDCPQCRKRSRTQPTLQPSKILDPMELEQPAEDILKKVLITHKASMKRKYECLFEGIPMHQNKTHLNSIYTQLYIIEGENKGVNEEHEVLKVQKTFRGYAKGVPVNFSDIFRPLPEEGLEQEMKEVHERKEPEEKKFKTVITKGIAGIGKTVSVQKFVVDWAEGKANEDVDFMFMLPFRELNLIKDEQYSLHGLLCVFHPEVKELDPKMYDVCKIMFILDGLDESRISLNINTRSPNAIVSDVTKQSTVGVLMTSIIKGELLPSALIWITTRPAAASQIPSQYVSRVTEIQGFNDPQREEYFKKRISDPYQASRVFSQITKAKTLHIMCHIPIFCWISSIVIQEILDQDECGEIPTTLTEMYIRFMLIQTKTKKLKYHVKEDEEQENEMILKLAELAFKQLIKGNILFYVEDLRECGIDVTQASVYSGVCTEIFKEESVLYQKKVYCFVHLSFQEFFAALFGFHACVARDAEVVKMFQSRSSKHNGTFVSQFMMPAMDAALASKTGHLDLFLRFLCGISQESNWEQLYHIVPPKCMISENFQEAIKCVRQKHPKNISPERWINFLYCFSEMKDHSSQREIKELLNAKRRLTEWECTRIAHTLQMSEEVLDEFDPKKYNTSDEGRRRLIPVVRNCRKALLTSLRLTDKHCEKVFSALQSTHSVLTELDLSYNHICDSGVQQICHSLKNPHCRLMILRLDMCNLTKKSCEYLAAVLLSAKSTLKELDLCQNDLEDSGVRQLSEGLKSPHCQLEKLSLSGCLVTEEGCASLASALSSNPSSLRELDLSYNHPGESGKKLLWAKVKDPTYTLEKLNLDHGGVFRMKPGVRKYACELTVDLDTVNSSVVLSRANRTVTFVCPDRHLQFDPAQPKRSQHPQLLCRESLFVRCYWEVEWSGWKSGIAVAYSGTTSKFGSDENSWLLLAFNNKYILYHKDKKVVIPGPYSNRVGVYLDWPSDMLSFYNVNGSTLKHLYSVQCRFTKPLYAGFYVYDASVSLCPI
ncbi:hypothetical protein NFI96_034164 [Prochilodus magdalenae]|nr:hypothetical protein NFI96_034164 [Prochilodus magdalenae]